MKPLLLLMTSFFFMGVVNAMPIKSSTSKGLQCRSGQICAMICNKNGATTYSLYEFAHYNPVDHFFTRIIQNDPLKSRDAQVQEAGERLGQVDTELGTHFNKKFRTLVKANEFDFGNRKKAFALPKDDECISIKLAGYYRKYGMYVVDAKIYGQLGNTDRAGLVSRLALIKVAVEKKVGPEHLVDLERLNRRLFYTEADDKILSKVRNEPPATLAQLQQGIRTRASIAFQSAAQVAVVRSMPNVFRSLPAPPAPPLPTVPDLNTNNVAANPPANIIPGSDIVPTTVAANTNLDGGYAVPKLIGLPPEPQVVDPYATATASNGVPVQPEMQAAPLENQNIPPMPMGAEIDPNTNNSVQALPTQEQPPQPALR